MLRRSMKKIQINALNLVGKKTWPTLELWRESSDSETKSTTIPPPHYQGFWQKTRKYSGTSKPTQG
jgi:hypothetical protein